MLQCTMSYTCQEGTPVKDGPLSLFLLRHLLVFMLEAHVHIMSVPWLLYTLVLFLHVRV